MIKKSDRDGNDSVTMGNGKSEATEWYGDVPVTLCDMEGNTKGDSKMTHVAYVPTSKFNLFSLTRMMINNWILRGDENSIWLEKGRKKIVFDIKITTSTGAIYCMYMKRKFELTNMSTDGKRKEVTYTVLQAHERLGHSNEDAMRATADAIGMKLRKGGMGTCLACTIGKAKQKNVKNKSEGNKSKEPGGRMYLDISTAKDKKGEPKITKNNWRIMVDKSTKLKISHFYAKKDGVCETTCELIKKLKEMEIEIKILRMNNAGENKLLQQRCESKDWQFAMKYEYTGRYTPHHNHMAELGFTTLENKGRALTVRANIPMNKRYLLFREAFKTATYLDCLS
jgi:hypothetical protein